MSECTPSLSAGAPQTAAFQHNNSTESTALWVNKNVPDKLTLHLFLPLDAGS